MPPRLYVTTITLFSETADVLHEQGAAPFALDLEDVVAVRGAGPNEPGATLVTFAYGECVSLDAAFPAVLAAWAAWREFADAPAPLYSRS